MTEILNGRVLARTIRQKAADRISHLSQPPGLAVILVGDNPASSLYVKLKEEAAREVGIYVERLDLPSDISTEELVDKIKTLNLRQDIHGILVQLPLVDQDTDTVINAIHPTKDVDGFHQENRRALLDNAPVLVPPVALAIMRLIQATRRPIRGAQAVIVGNSEIFAEPLIELLREAEVEGVFVQRNAPNLNALTRDADIVVVAAGAAGILTKDAVREGAIVIDVGTNKTADGKVVGDAHPNIDGWAGFVSPVPGGVGPLTVAYLLMNVIKAQEVQARHFEE